MTISKRTLAVGATVLVVAGGAGAAIAATRGSSGTADAFVESLAEHLGVSTDVLEDAAKAAAIDQVDAALDDGRITEEQADALKERIEEGDSPFFFGPPLFAGPDLHHGGGAFVDGFDAAAEYLGLSEDELRERLSEGQSLAEIARAEDKSVDGLKQAMLGEAEESLDQAVEDEDLTREQADRILDRLRDHIDDLVNGDFRFGGPPGPLRPGPEFFGRPA
jgi:hypothetical protein